MLSEAVPLRAQLNRQIAHWKIAVVTLDDPENFASREAWQRIEHYLSLSLRTHLNSAVVRLRNELNGLNDQLSASQTLEQLSLVSKRLLEFRQQYIATETTLDFFGDAINTRTNPKIFAILRALDVIAYRSMETVLKPLGKEIPPVCIYIDKGMGASILKAKVRMWDKGTINPVAAIKITRHNLYRPTSIIHETGHQVAHILGWDEEFASVLQHEISLLAPTEVVDGWVETSSEIVADIYGFVHCGYAAVAALHDVVAADPLTVLRYIPGDPHPIPYIRVLLNVEFCKLTYGAGPWDNLATAWKYSHPLINAASSTRRFLENSINLLPRLAELSLRRRLRCFGGRAISELVQPEHVRPHNLLQWSSLLGSALYTSSYWARTEPIRLLALSGYEIAVSPERAAEIAKKYEAWMQNMFLPTNTK